VDAAPGSGAGKISTRFFEETDLLAFRTWNARVRLLKEASMSTKSKEWKLVRGSWISAEPILPGVWQRKECGHVVRGRATDPRTGKQRDVWRVLVAGSKHEAYQWLQKELGRIRSGEFAPAASKTPFASFATSLLKRKIDSGDIQSAAGVEKWENALMHLIAGRIGEMFVESIRTRDIEAWRGDMAAKVNAGQYAPTTINTWLGVLKVVLEHAKRELELPQNAARDVAPLDISRHRVYSREEPNSLTVEELRDFLACMREMAPHYFAMTYTGFATGLRPSSLRPLRRQGETPDIDWTNGVLLVRQSNARGDIVMESTKTARDQEIAIPQELVDVLRWHVDTQLHPGPQQESDLLFPSELGGFRSRSCLDKPFADVAAAIGLKKHISPRAMRRTFQDLARAAEVRDVVTRSISGHATEEMQRRYSTVSAVEQQTSLARVLRLMDFRRAKRLAAQSGEASGEGGRAGGEDQ
jgi:integrase